MELISLFLHCQLCIHENDCRDHGLRHYKFVGLVPQLSCNGKIVLNREGEEKLLNPEFPLICQKCGTCFKDSQPCRRQNLEAAVPVGSPPLLIREYRAAIK